MSQVNACLIIIGNEILSGRTQDTNLAWLAARLNGLGIRLLECRVIPDIEETIIRTVNACRREFTYVFTTGGIGPTHDDITTHSIAKAFGQKVIRHPDAEKRLRAHYVNQEVNEARLKMAETPEHAVLIDNPVSAAPGFIVENVYVMAGVPRIMQAMFDTIKHTLKGGAPMLSSTLTAFVTEGTIAAELTAIQNAYPTVEIGSYPFVKDGKLGTCLVARAEDKTLLEQCSAELHTLLAKFGVVEKA